MNENFINIKVDMEDCPDIDTIDVSSVELTTRSGGRPLDVLLTPDQIPFFGGTSFPPPPRYEIQGLDYEFTSIADANWNRLDETMHSAKYVFDGIKTNSVEQPDAKSFSNEIFDSG